MAEHLILGSSGYIGRNLVSQFEANQVVRVAGKSRRSDAKYSIDLSEEVLDDSHPLFVERPVKLFILARPAEVNYFPNRVFYLNLQSLLLNWCATDQLKSVHFISTTNLYSIKVPGAKSTACPVAPYGTYEYFKLETELFLDYLNRNFRPDVDFNVIRIPIAFGGIHNPAKDQNQYLYSFIESYRHGWAWEFNSTEDEQFGTSWIDTVDLVRTIAGSRFLGGGYRLRNATSGFFTYKSLHEYLMRRLEPEIIDKIRLFRSRVLVKDELDLPQRNIEKTIEGYLG